MNHCLRHYEEPVNDHCRNCRHPFCTRCLVYSFGPKKPPLCVSCALHAGGIRTGPAPIAAPPEAADGAEAPMLDKRTQRAFRRAERDAVKLATRAAKRAARSGGAPVPIAGPEPARADAVPAPPADLAGASRYGTPTAS